MGWVAEEAWAIKLARVQSRVRASCEMSEVDVRAYLCQPYCPIVL